MNKKIKQENELLSRTESPDVRNQTLLAYAPVVAFIARRLAARLPRSVELDDLVSSGFLGLMGAFETYDASKETSFRHFCEWRIRGAMLDELRQLDLAPRSVREKIRKNDRVRRELRQDLGRAPDMTEIAESMGLEIEEYHQFLSYNQPPMLHPASYTIDQNGSRQEFNLPDNKSLHTNEDRQLRGERARLLRFYLNTLPKQQAMVLNLYYFFGLNLRESAEVLEISESRVSQVRKMALARLGSKLERSEAFSGVESYFDR